MQFALCLLTEAGDRPRDVGNGIINAFDLNGNFLRRVLTGGK